ncbi:Crp/Fnr family transcriptional regulator [Altererythrobacter arenosus]|uniref:Crp/Fnr family transcriptional regulator n=1 Tax=Altererythrobacter arenosus TaxID=3032592 RepID=A0ABY8FVR7_9SPHN|nr:Crp/Fnr family transcriptional regulator [Altererythrobacter sp. CAU 1644]WFL76114.1 Crp/Fnr family transcriptional regulator [Altererythrobacter sp. CAU 1644]
MNRRAQAVACRNCPLQKQPRLRTLDERQIDYLQDFKRGEMSVEREGMVIEQGQFGPHLYTVLEGVLIRYRTLDDGRRQIVNFVFPGDLIGLQSAFEGPANHAVEALVEARLCMFERKSFPEFIGQHPRLAYDIVWLAAAEETQLEEHLVALGQRTAKERLVYLAVWLVDRAQISGISDKGNTLTLPITQSQVADMLGLSLVHTNRTLRALLDSGLVEWRPGEIHIPDMDAACEFAQYERDTELERPFI